MAQQEIELRCECSRRPLLGKAGRDKDGNPYVHVKVYKQKRIYGEIIATEGTVRLRCRECFRWFAVRIVRKATQVAFSQEPLPEALSVN